MRAIGMPKRWACRRATPGRGPLQLGQVAPALLVLALVLIGQQQQQQPWAAEARSLLNKIPGMGKLEELANDLVGAVGRRLDSSRLVRALGQPVSECLGGASGAISEACGLPVDPDAKRNVSEIIRSRGFLAEEHDVTTRDGYILTVQRIVNPLVAPEHRAALKPVILQHGLMSSSVDWVINSPHVKPAPLPERLLARLARTPGALSGAKNQDSREEEADDNNDDDDDDDDDEGDGGDKDKGDDRLGALVNDALEKADDSSDNNNNNNSIEGHQGALAAGGGGGGGEAGRDSQEHPNALGFYLANQGYDVFLANSRGNIYGRRHASLNSWQPKFWAFTFDEQIKYDLPDTIEFVKKLTGGGGGAGGSSEGNSTAKRRTIGYVGHSQGTTMALGLLADQPEFADVLEPVVLLAPVAYCNHALSPVRHFAFVTPVAQHINMWFGSSNAAVRYLAPIVCGPKVVRKEICENIIFLSTGYDEAEFDANRASAFLAHMPSGTSVKNIAHWGQQVNSGRFAHFDHGLLGNQMRYNQTRAPDYQLAKIRSKSLVMFTAENDWLASPIDVARLKAELQVPFTAYNVSELNPAWNHIDFVYGLDAGVFVNERILEQFHKYDERA